MATDGEVLLRDGDAAASILPRRGGMATRFAVGGRELFYLDEATLGDPAKNVRGGAPVLFPSPGKLAGDAFLRDGRGGRMGQHGFARNREWAVVERSAGAVRLRIEDDEASRAAYPFRFRCELSYSLVGNALRIESRVACTGDSPMPFGFGFHPYFLVPEAEKATARIPTKATRAFDNATKRVVEYVPPALGGGEVDLHLLDHGGSSAELRWASGAVSLRGSPEYATWVIWTLPARDFVCLEPWTCPGNALNTGEALLFVAPGEERTLWLEIAAG